LNKSPLNILFVIDGLRPGGKERQLVEIIKNIDRSRFYTGILTFNRDQHYSRTAKEYSRYYRELKKRPSRLKPLFSIWRCIREFKPDVVHTWDIISSFYAYFPCKYYRIPLINGSVRDSGIEKGFQYQLKRFLLKQADAVVANSEAGLKAYKSKGEVIYNAINPERFHAPSITDEFNLIMTANFSDYKDHETFLKAALKLVRDKTVSQVFLPGDGPNMGRCKALIEKEAEEIRRHFHFPGVVGNIEEYLSTCIVGVLCSTQKYSEGLSNSVLEYMAAGVIPIVTNIGGSTEIVEDNRNGFLIAEGDHRKIVDLVRQLKNDPALQQRISRQAKETIESKFSLTPNLEKLCLLYESLAESNPSPRRWLN
jgi:glycosyltransferase involved in cell wall biosynthesis